MYNILVIESQILWNSETHS